MTDKELLDKLIEKIIAFKEYNDNYYCGEDDYHHDMGYLYELTLSRGETL